MRWHNGGNEKVRIWSIFNTLFGHMERKCGERKRLTQFYLFCNKKALFFLCCKDTFSSTMRSSFLLWEWVHFLQTFFVLHFPLFYTQTRKRCVFFSFLFFSFLFHLLNNWGKRKKTQNLIEIWFSCAIYNQLWVEDFMND